MSRCYVLYDMRVLYRPERATVFCIEHSRRLAERTAKDYGECVCISHKIDNGTLINDRYEFHTDSNGSIL